jgi:hypothetical protein
MKTLKNQWNRFATLIGAGVASVVLFTALWVWGQSVPQPVLTIAPLGSNAFAITITNGVTNGAYVLYWTPVLADEANYPWEPVSPSQNLGETNWNLDMGIWPSGYFKVITGTDWDNDGILNWVDGDPMNPSVGILNVIIDSPLNGSTID